MSAGTSREKDKTSHSDLRHVYLNTVRGREREGGHVWLVEREGW